MREMMTYVAGFLVLCCIVYGTYYIGKTISYSLAYEDMVEETIKEKVKEQCLK